MSVDTVSVNISLDTFEGPLALLLYLIRKEEMNIYDIPIHRITQQYLDHIKLMGELDLEVASEFITMAATLIYIKSKMLLPQHESEDEPTEDPRKGLVLRLLEYQKYQDAAKNLNHRTLLGREVWGRGMREDLLFVAEGSHADIELEEKAMFNMISMYRFLIKSLENRVHRVMVKAQSVASRILELRDYLIPGQRVTMRSLIKPFEMARVKLIVTFLSLLELTKMGFTQLYQTDVFNEIYIEPLRTIDRDIIQRIDDYDASKASEIQSALGLNIVKLEEGENEIELVTLPTDTEAIETESIYEGVAGATDDDIEMAEQELSNGEDEGGIA